VATIGVVHFPAHGHVRPAIRLGRTIAAAGHRVVHWAPAEYRDDVERSGGELRPMGELLGPGAENATSDDVIAGAAGGAVQLTPRTVEELHAEGADLVVNDVQAPWGRVAGEFLGLPTICSWPLFPPVGWLPRTQGPAPVHAQFLRDCWEIVGRRWGVELYSPHDALGSLGDVNIVYTTREVAAAEAGPSWLFAGPLMDDGDHAAEPAVDGDDARPLVYVALGTVYTSNARLFRNVLEALAGEPVRVLVATWGRLSADDLAPVPDNAVVTARVDSRAVLRRAEVHVSHGGAGSAHESVLEGVPMLLVPQGSDQSLWTERLVDLGVGARAESESPEAIRAGVLGLLEDESMRDRTGALGARLRAYDGAGVVAGAVEELLR
jgi:MGT family glycosyltransferase